MKLTIIIVNYKTARLLLNCIASVYKYSHENVEIIVVDNASEDDCEALLKLHYPQIIFLQMGYNAGFARANNKGITMSRADAVLLLNSDTIIKENAIQHCFKNFMSSEFIAAGVQLLNEDGSPQISGNFAMKGGINYLLPLPFLGKFLRAIALFLKVKKTNVPDASGVVEVDWINGAFLMVKRKIIDKAGLLDEDFFLYAEEAEWCSRLKKQGKLCIYGEAHVIHLQGKSSGEAFNSPGKGYYNLFDKKGLQIMLSNFVRIRKEFGKGWFFFNLFFYFITIPVFFIGLAISKIFFWKKSRYNFSQWSGFSKNVFSLISYMPRIIKNKPFFYKVL